MLHGTFTFDELFSFVVSNRLQQINKMTYENRNEMNKSYYLKKH